MLNALSSHSKLVVGSTSSTSSKQRLLATSTCSSPNSTSGKMDLRGSQQLESKLGLNLNMSSSDSSSNGGNSYHSISNTNSNNNNNNNNNCSSNNNNNNNNSNSTNHHNHNHSQLSNNLSNFHLQQQQQFQQQLGNQQVESIEANKGYTFEEQFKQLYELSENPKRKEFLDDLFQFMADRNQPVNRIPIMAKQVLDLYELYNLVVARGGLVEVINKKIWREITKGLNLPSSITSAAFTLRTQYMKYLYPYECAKNNFSHQDELQQAIDGNRREGRRAGATNLSGYAPYLAGGGGGGVGDGGRLGAYSASPSPNHLFAGHNLLSQVVQQQQQQHQLMQQQQQQQQNQAPGQQQSQQQPLQLRHQNSAEQCEPQRPQSGSSDVASPSFNQQRLYQDSIESDHEDEDSIDLGHSSKRNSPIDLEHQHLDPHTQHHLSQQQVAEQQRQQLAAAAAAALRQQFGAAFNFAGAQNFLGQLPGQVGGNLNQNLAGAPNLTASNNNHGSSPAVGHLGEVAKQQQEQFLAAIMALANQQQQQQQQQQPQQPQPPQAQPHQPQPQSATPPDQQAAARAALSNASNAMLISAANVPDAMTMATAAQAIGVKGAFIILLL